MTVVNIRGTSGSGKTTLVRAVMAAAEHTEPVYTLKRRNPLYYCLQLAVPGGWAQVSVLGHYAATCGGCDTLPTYDVLFDLVRQQHALGHHVLFEGLLVAHDRKRCAELWDWLGHKDLAIVELTEPLEVCLAAVQSRRDARGATKPFNPANTIERYEGVKRSCRQLEALGVPIYRESRSSALLRVGSLLGLQGELTAAA